MNLGKHIIVDLHGISNLKFETISKQNYHKFDDIIKNTLEINGQILLSKIIHHFDNIEFVALYLLA